MELDEVTRQRLTIVVCRNAQDGMRWQKNNPRPHSKVLRIYKQAQLVPIPPEAEVEIVRTQAFIADPDNSLEAWASELSSVPAKAALMFLLVSGVLYAVDELHLHVTTDTSGLGTVVPVHDDLRRWGEVRVADERVAFIASNARIMTSPSGRHTTVELVEPIVWIDRSDRTVNNGGTA